MSHQKFESFSVIGIAVRTTNENNQAGVDINALWTRFMSENIMDQIPNKLDYSVYSIYTDYEKDHTKPYTTILGCKVSTLAEIPEGMIGKVIEGGVYTEFTAKGNILKGMVYEEWVRIWNSDINRAYTADFEVYGAKAKNIEDAEVPIFIALKS